MCHACGAARTRVTKLAVHSTSARPTPSTSGRDVFSLASKALVILLCSVLVAALVWQRRYGGIDAHALPPLLATATEYFCWSMPFGFLPRGVGLAAALAVLTIRAATGWIDPALF